MNLLQTVQEELTSGKTINTTKSDITTSLSTDQLRYIYVLYISLQNFKEKDHEDIFCRLVYD